MHALRMLRTALIGIVLLALGCGDEEPDLSDQFYDPNHVLEVDVTLPASDWDALRLETRSFLEILSGEDCVSQPFPNVFNWYEGSVTLDGTDYARVDVRKKGFIGSLSETRPGLKLDLSEFVDGQRHLSVRRVTLNNSIADPAVIRQCLGYQLFADAGIPASRCSFAHVVVNGEDLGLYVNVEPLKGPFLRRHYGSSEGNLYEGTLSDFREGMIATFEPKNHESVVERDDLEPLLRALDASDDELVSALSAVVDLDEFLTFLAMETLLVHTDGYGANRNNFYVYIDPSSGLMRFIPWGIDGILRAQEVAGDLFESIYDRGALANRVHSHPELSRRYFARMTDLLETVWNEDAILSEVQRMEELLTPVVSGASRDRLIEAIGGVRAEVMDRRSRVEMELASLPSARDLPAPFQCARAIGTAETNFRTKWGTLDREEFFSSSITFTLELEGEAIIFQAVGVAAGVGDQGPAVVFLGVVPGGVLYVISLSMRPEWLTPSTLEVDPTRVGGFLGTLNGEEFTLLGLLSGELTFTEADSEPDAVVAGRIDVTAYAFSL